MMRRNNRNVAAENRSRFSGEISRRGEFVFNSKLNFVLCKISGACKMTARRRR
ncbi:MAG: hypothetical protein ACR2QC_12580 [Gammaproteobacteria bacterium]